ncbi:hypothetical protein MRX96_034167 [Rhipicephalus microplus]
MPENNSLKHLLFNYIFNGVGKAIGAVSKPLFYPLDTRAMSYGELDLSMALQMAKTCDSKDLKGQPRRCLAYFIISRYTLRKYQAIDGCFDKEGFPSVFPEIPAFEITYDAYVKSNETYL